ncbi:MAG: hypothetical protein CVT79_13060 [Alphaproteobacteria bacterium HGW-Alphaproteobacteria-18]|nr:MAG: hypothetical protein CVT79_13060 [Alphaproteobacteria bacterium HGW-Alphaproteobacteria-18]
MNRCRYNELEPRGGLKLTQAQTFDPRSIANLILDMADDEGYNITPLALQKLLYFAHGLYLIRHNAPLVSGCFEAWQNGPVHPLVYKCFKSSGRLPIRTRAKKKDIRTGQEFDIDLVEDVHARRIVRSIVSNYGHMNPWQLVQISHAEDSPWDVVVNKAKTSIALGLRISDTTTKDFFKNQKVSISSEPPKNAPEEDSPFAA